MNGKGRLRAAIEAKLKKDEPSFIPYLTAGDPSLALTEKYIQALAKAGADAIELGVPYSDPVADGPVNLMAAERALKSGTTLKDVLALSKRLRGQGVETPFVIFSYYNPLYRMGLKNFAESAKASGIDAVLTVDLPVEEADELRQALSGAGLGAVFLASPTTPAARLAKVAEASTEFVYYVSRVGVTGAQARLSDTLGPEVERLRKATGLPVGVGFGISTPEQAAAVGRIADAVIVGSALVKKIEEGGSQVEAFSKGIAEAVRASRQRK